MIEEPFPHETICAIATPMGQSGIGVIRISGASAFQIAEPLFHPKIKKGVLSSLPTHTVHYADVVDPKNQHVIDEAYFLITHAPHTYTGENTVEIQSHGNPYLLQKILSLLVQQGARLAGPGEFTRRAFLAGRMDLAQAEAVMELIASQDNQQHEWALSQLRGRLSERINCLKENLIAVVTTVEASIEFLEQGICTDSPDKIAQSVEAIREDVLSLIAGYDEGRKIKDGFVVVIVGRPNVGKSSLMNLLLDEERAIVTPYPGTTRDLLRESLQMGGLSLQIVDTAGFRKTPDPIEAEGVRRAEAMLQKADLVLLVLDASEPLQEEDHCIIHRMEQCHRNDHKRIVILNKCDLPPQLDMAGWDERRVCLSAQTGEGLAELRRMIREALMMQPERDPPLVVLLRHKQALEKVAESLSQALVAVQSGFSVEFIAADLKWAIEALEEIVGSTTTDEILNQVFNRFCIGK